MLRRKHERVYHVGCCEYAGVKSSGNRREGSLKSYFRVAWGMYLLPRLRSDCITNMLAPGSHNSDLRVLRHCARAGFEAAARFISAIVEGLQCTYSERTVDVTLDVKICQLFTVDVKSEFQEARAIPSFVI